jgi:hypothetical protein
MPKPTAANSEVSIWKIKPDQHRQLTHEAPISDCEESGLGVEGDVRSGAFRIVVGTGSLDLGGGEAAAGNSR